MATNTKNYNFKKPDESDFYDIQDQNGNWDIADEKMEELSAPTFEDYSGTTSVPEASTAIEAIKSKKKIPEILANIKAAFKGVCLLGHIVNNCVTDNAKLPLSAAQGKALMDQITKLNSEIGYIQNYDIDTLSSPSQLTHSGYYQFVNCSSTVNDNASTKFTDYQIGDFVGLLITRNGYATSDAGCQWGTFIITSPRFTNKFWIGRIWGYKFVNFIKIGS